MSDPLRSIIGRLDSAEQAITRLQAAPSAAVPTMVWSTTQDGWWRVAQGPSDGNNTWGLWSIRWDGLNRHGEILVYVGAQYHNAAGVGIHILGSSRWSGVGSAPVVTALRVLITPGTNTTIFFEIACANTSGTVQIEVKRVAGFGWGVINAIPGSLPTGYTAVTRTVPDVNDWKPFTMNAGWTAYPPPWAAPAYRLLPNNMVVLRGLVQRTTAALSTVACVLPPGHRPGAYAALPVMTEGAIGRITITPDGNIFVLAMTSNWISLDGITFFADV